MSRFVLKLIPFIFTLSWILSFSVYAQTTQQIQQFKNLPRAKQQQLANQLGIDLTGIARQSNNATGLSDNNKPMITYPRGTQFDEFGNPVNSNEDIFKNNFKSEDENELKLYGLELFANSPSTFTPTSNVPVPANYILGPGDQIVVHLYGKQNEEYQLIVGRDGNVVIPKLGPFNIATKSFTEAKTFLVEQIGQQIIGVKVSVSMGELRTIRVFVTGEAYKPGAYNVSSLSTITHALFVSGGVTDIASLRNIQLKRAGKLVQTLDLYDLLLQGNTSDDVLLQSGDAIFIPPVQITVSIDGQVRRPAIYELKGNESLSEAILLAGGVLSNGYEKSIGIERVTNGQKVQLTVDNLKQNIKVSDGDKITVPEVSEYVSDSITLIGDVARPGNYQWSNSLSVFSLLGDVKRELSETADLNYILILRENTLSREIDVLQADLTMPAAQGDVALKPLDKVLVFSIIESVEFADEQVGQFAYTAEKLKENEKNIWQKRIEEKLFWRSVGLVNEPQLQTYEFNSELAQMPNQPIIELTKAEKEKIEEFKDNAYFSRKRMLAPVIAMLRDQAKYGSPLKLVEVAGEVKVPGFYPLTQQASIQNLIKAAGGLTEAAYPEKSEITRTEFNSHGEAQVQHIEFKPFDELKSGLNATNSLSIKSKDRINIYTTPSWQEELTISVKGEVEFPGDYTIRRGETLSELLTRVGGLTKYGDANSVVFTREVLKEQERKNLQTLAEELRKQIASESLRRKAGAGSIVSYDEARKLLRDLTSKEAVGRLVIDLSRLISGDKSQNVILEDGDVLYVPVHSQSVNVMGEVYVPTSHLFAEGQNLTAYIEKSGGYRSLADEERVYVIRANGEVVIPNSGDDFWFNSEQNVTKILPGDTIVVPFDSDNVDNMTLWTNATQIVYQLAVAVAAIGSL
ncbi:SLBB domain-containing protein [Paraglaciecola aquimarina]|uniref:SLBB domain-containing protein n=1 Tax=Paraglaciecola algarum TaxID=3050085 RepID=A0ABS9D682_9ALTE|nr:SLBB domain-containing protein [Paraglaciecola sp. G1-23]MCF2948448.1 SLBB domain-containing protein [Paraglaciecola sp. G1-23]